LIGYLVDTNIIVDVTHGSAEASDYLDSLGDAWSISMITCLELLAGARTQRETDDLHLVLTGYRAVPPNEDIARRAYYLVKTYARSHGLDALDALIAATALEEGLTLATKTVSTSRRSTGTARVQFSVIPPGRI
jgi:predicted nucleic acid-binding protein